jgi:hypothetical protein
MREPTVWSILVGIISKMSVGEEISRRELQEHCRKKGIWDVSLRDGSTLDVNRSLMSKAGVLMRGRRRGSYLKATICPRNFTKADCRYMAYGYRYKKGEK